MLWAYTHVRIDCIHVSLYIQSMYIGSARCWWNKPNHLHGKYIVVECIISPKICQKNQSNRLC